MNEKQPSCSRARRVASVLVGLFATWQLVAIPATNVMNFVPLRERAPALRPNLNPYQTRGTFTESEPLQTAADGAGHVLGLWAEMSGQEQGWSLFAPGPPPYSVFVAAEFQWADGTSDTLLSRYEPRDLSKPPLRAPLVCCRHYHFEVQFVYPVWYASREAVAQHPQIWADIPDAVHASGPEIRAWLRWRLNEYRAANPHGPPPRAVVLKHRYISTPRPSEPTDAPRTIEERPYARWVPETDELEAFDMVAARFVPLGVQP